MKHIYVNAEITYICLFLKYEDIYEDININLTAKMVQHYNVLRTHLVLNHKLNVSPNDDFLSSPQRVNMMRIQ